MTFVRILSCPYSIAHVLVRPTSPHFDAVYAERSGVPKKEELEPMLMMDPPPDFLINGMAAFEHIKVPVRLILIVSSHSFVSISSSFTDGPAMPEFDE